MKFEKTAISGVLIGQAEKIADSRGSFLRFFCNDSYREATGHDMPLSQMNKSLTTARGSLRGLHFQREPALEAKVIRCTKGRVFDVAVDLRENSPTYLKHVSIELYEDGPVFVIPAGCAHGFQTLTDDAEMLYLHSAPWSKAHEGGLLYNDPALQISWPLPVTVISDRDRGFLPLDATFRGIAA